MKKNYFFAFILFSLFSLSSFASHIVGGDITVKWISGNNFEITISFFRDCKVGNTGFDPSIKVGIFDMVTNAGQPTVTIPVTDSITIPLGDACYMPNLCIKRARYIKTVTIPNNSNGYYISYHRCCRNAIIDNIKSPSDDAGYVFYCEIPNPALHNTSPVFNTVPDGFMCKGYPNTESYTATDADGDKLVYSFSTPLDCTPDGICSNSTVAVPACTFGSPDPCDWPKRPGKTSYGTITWKTGYSLTNPVGDPAQSINAATGIVSTKPPTLGVYVFCVKVEEYRAGVKIGEIRRDFQFQVLPCYGLVVNTNPTSGAICLGQSATLTAMHGPNGPFTYSWSPNIGSTSAVVITPTATGTYTLTVTNGTCSTKTPVTLTVNALPSTSVTPTGSLCLGQNTTLIASGGISYIWNNGMTTTAISGVPNGTYTVTATDNNGCSAKATGAIYQMPVLTSTVSITNTACSGIPASATVSASGGSPGFAYLWGTSPAQTAATATGLVSGNYSVTVTDVKGCTSVKNFNIALTATPSVSVTPNTAKCGVANGTATAIASGGTAPYSYLWNNGQTSQIAIALAGGSYSVTVTDATGCSTTTTVNVPKTLAPVASIASSQNVLCFGGNSGNATVSVASGQAPFSYLWSNGQTSQTATGFSIGTYSVLVTDVNGCTSAQTVTLSQPSAPVSLSAIGGGSSCGPFANGTATAIASGGTSPYTYLWNPGGKTTSAISNLSAGTYSVLITDNNGCTKMASSSIVASTQPKADFTYTYVISCEGIKIQFNNTSSQASSALWNFGDGSAASNETNPSHVFPGAGSYSVTLYVTNPPCKDTKVGKVLVGDVPTGVVFGAANVFSPNGDNKNDCFHPALTDVNNGQSIDTLVNCISLVVYDRWGIKMFESKGGNSADNCWNGNTKNGQPASDGSYFYTATFSNTTIKGYVTLVRHK